MDLNTDYCKQQQREIICVSARSVFALACIYDTQTEWFLRAIHGFMVNLHILDGPG